MEMRPNALPNKISPQLSVYFGYKLKDKQAKEETLSGNTRSVVNFETSAKKEPGLKDLNKEEPILTTEELSRKQVVELRNMLKAMPRGNWDKVIANKTAETFAQFNDALYTFENGVTLAGDTIRELYGNQAGINKRAMELLLPSADEKSPLYLPPPPGVKEFQNPKVMKAETFKKKLLAIAPLGYENKLFYNEKQMKNPIMDSKFIVTIDASNEKNAYHEVNSLTYSSEGIGVRLVSRKKRAYTFELDFGDIGYPRIGDNSWNPRYVPKYTSIPYDRRFLTTLRYAFSQGKFRAEDERHVKTGYKEACSIAKKHFFGNGTPSGQIERLKSVWEVYSVSVNAEYVPNLAFEDYCAIMDKVYPISEPFTSLVDFRSMWPGNDRSTLLTFNLDANAGLLWNQSSSNQEVKGGRLVRETVIQNLLLATQMLDSISELLHSGEDITPDFEENWGFIRQTEFKPKSEVYLASDRDKKTRNYWPVNNFANLPAQAMFRAVHSKEKLYYPKDRNSSSLIGFSPYHGGLDKLLKTAMSDVPNPGDFKLLCYADNLFCMLNDDGKFHWFSLDASKMEGCVERKISEFENRRIIKVFKDAGYAVGPEFEWYLTQYFPRIVQDSISVYNSVGFHSYTMGSGVMGTAYYNTCKMALFMDYLSKNKVCPVYRSDEKDASGAYEWRKSPMFEEAAKQVGLSMKLEKYQLDLMNSKIGTLLTLDCLGNDAVGYYSRELNKIMFIPILNKDRVWKAVLFAKKKLVITDKGEFQNEAQLLLYQYIRLTTMFIIGGWWYNSTSIILRKEIRALWKALRSRVKDVGTAIMQAATYLFSSEFGDSLFGPSTLLSVLRNNVSVPTLHSIITLCANEEFANQFVTKTVYKIKRFKNLPKAIIGPSPAKIRLEALDADLENYPKEESYDEEEDETNEEEEEPSSVVTHTPLEYITEGMTFDVREGNEGPIPRHIKPRSERYQITGHDVTPDVLRPLKTWLQTNRNAKIYLQVPLPSKFFTLSRTQQVRFLKNPLGPYVSLFRMLSQAFHINMGVLSKMKEKEKIKKIFYPSFQNYTFQNRKNRHITVQENLISPDIYLEGIVTRPYDIDTLQYRQLTPGSGIVRPEIDPNWAAYHGLSDEDFYEDKKVKKLATPLNQNLVI
jgi:hypothetical protein